MHRFIITALILILSSSARAEENGTTSRDPSRSRQSLGRLENRRERTSFQIGEM